MIGKVAGGSAMYSAMNAMGFAAESPYAGPVQLQQGAPKGTTVLWAQALPGWWLPLMSQTSGL